MRNKKLLVLSMGMVFVLAMVGCGNIKQVKKLEEAKEVIALQTEPESELEEEVLEEIPEEVVEEPIQTESVKSDTYKPVSSSKPSSATNTKPEVSQTVQTPTNTKPQQQTQTQTKECSHSFDYEFKEYKSIKHYVYGCNGCGYPLFTIQGGDAINLPNLYSHPACYSEKLGMNCVGGGYHSEMYYRGFCVSCHDEIQLRSCMFTETGKMCVKNEALGAYQKVVLGKNPDAYLKSCRCGQNNICVDGSSGKGLMIVKQTCTKCGLVENFPKR